MKTLNDYITEKFIDIDNYNIKRVLTRSDLKEGMFVRYKTSGWYAFINGDTFKRIESDLGLELIPDKFKATLNYGVLISIDDSVSRITEPNVNFMSVCWLEKDLRFGDAIDDYIIQYFQVDRFKPEMVYRKEMDKVIRKNQPIDVQNKKIMRQIKEILMLRI